MAQGKVRQNSRAYRRKQKGTQVELGEVRPYL